MPKVAWSVARAEISRETGYVEFATTTNIAADNQVISTTLADRFTSDDYFIGWFILFRSGNNVGRDNLRVTDYAASTGTLTVAGAALTADSEAITCELHRFPPRTLRDHFNQASQDLFPLIGIQRDVQSIVTGQRQTRYTLPSSIRGKPRQVWMGKRITAETLTENELANPGFEEWSSPTNPKVWTTGAGTGIAQEKETNTPKNYAVLEGSRSAKVTSPVTESLAFYQQVTPTVATEGVQANFSVWVYCNVPGRVAAQCGEGPANWGLAGADMVHGGTGWELLTASTILGYQDTNLHVGVYIASGSRISIYVDEAILIMGQSEALDAGWAPLMNWHWIPPVDGENTGGTLEFPYVLGEKRRLRIIGMGLLSQVNSDSDTFELDGNALQSLYDLTRQYAAREMALSAPAAEQSLWRDVAGTFGRRVERHLQNGHYVRAPKSRFTIPDWGR